MKINLYHIFCLVILSSCAVQVPPGGGPKDTEPPKVVSMKPENKSINFRKTEIHLKFNEFVVLKNPEDQIVISPPVDEAPEYLVRGKTIRVVFRRALKLDKTYTINFGNSIADNHEGNVLDNFQYVFATGKYIDTNIVSGKVLNAFNRSPEKKISIGLYDSTLYTDSVIFKQKPIYFTKTKDDGSFSIENIPANNYVLRGFNDENKNIKYNQNETIFFSDSFLNSTDTLNRKNIYWIYKPDAYRVNRMLDTFSKETGKFCFLIYKPTNISIKPLKKSEYFTRIKQGNNNLDSVFIFSDELKDSVVSFHINQPDTLFDIKITRLKKIRYPVFGVNASPFLELNDSINIYCSNPFKSFDTSRIFLQQDSIRIKPKFLVGTEKEKLTLIYSWKEKTKYSLLVKDSAFIDIYGQWNKKFNIETATRAQKDYSSLQVNFLLNSTDVPLIIQLINAEENYIYKEFIIRKSEKKLFEYLLPGNYKIKIIQDRNSNGKWDNGDYFKKRQPENAFYFKENITLKAFWDLEQTVDLNTILKDE